MHFYTIAALFLSASMAWASIIPVVQVIKRNPGDSEPQPGWKPECPPPVTETCTVTDYEWKYKTITEFCTVTDYEWKTTTETCTVTDYEWKTYTETCTVTDWSTTTETCTVTAPCSKKGW
jgi:hypothetical protein